MSVPIFRGGRAIFGISGAQDFRDAVMHDVHKTSNEVSRGVIVAWNDYQATTAAIRARAEQIEASTIALEGVREQNKLGTMTTLDVLNAEQELLDARVGMEEAERNQFVSAYGVLASIGRLTGRALGIEEHKEEQENDDTR